MVCSLSARLRASSAGGVGQEKAKFVQRETGKKIRGSLLTQANDGDVKNRTVDHLHTELPADPLQSFNAGRDDGKRIVVASETVPLRLAAIEKYMPVGQVCEHIHVCRSWKYSARRTRSVTSVWVRRRDPSGNSVHWARTMRLPAMRMSTGLGSPD